MRALGGAALALTLAWLVQPATAAQEGGSCGRIVVFALPGVTWALVERERPPALLGMAAEGALGSLSMVTNEGSTSLGAAYVTLGAGSRADAPPRDLAAPPADSRSLARAVKVADPDRLRTLGARSGHSTRPGALAALVGRVGAQVGAIGNGAPDGATGDHPGPLLAALDPRGRVDFAATGAGLVRAAPGAPGGVRTDSPALHRALGEALGLDCTVIIVEHGDLGRAHLAEDDEDRPRALAEADATLRWTRRRLDLERDLLLALSPTSPPGEVAHLGIALAAGPGFGPGTALTSASTRRSGIVSLEDVAPTILAARGLATPSSMTGRAWVAAPSSSPEERVAEAVRLDEESVFSAAVQPGIVSWYVAVQVLVYVGAAAILVRAGEGALGRGRARALELLALAVVAFPLASYLASPLPAYELGAGALAGVIVALDVAVVALVGTLARDPLKRLLGICVATAVVLMGDIVTGGDLQPNALFGNYPVVGGRFAGLGNTGFAVLGGAALLSGALVAQLYGERRWARPAVAGLFAATVVVDGAPSLGSDVGGVLALVPVLGLTYVLLGGRRPTPGTVVAVVIAGVLVLAVFTAVDLARPPEARTHLGRLAEAVVDRGPQPVVDAIGRKLAANLGIFRLSLWSLFAPLVLAGGVVLAARWEGFRRTFPQLRIGLLMLGALAVLGSALNDSGIVIAAVMLPFLLCAAQVAGVCLSGGR